MSEGDAVIVPMEIADGTLKPRPGIVLRSMPPFGDPLICAVSSQLHQEVLGFDEPIVPGDGDFSSSGLRAPSLIRLGYLVMKSRRQIAGRIGFIDPKRSARLREKLSAYLLKAGS